MLGLSTIFGTALCAKRYHFKGAVQPLALGFRERRVIGSEQLVPKSVNECQNARIGPPVEFERACRILLGQGLGKAWIGTLESHDSLLGIADNQRMLGAARKVPEESELNGIGILELVHDYAIDLRHDRIEDGGIVSQKAGGIGHHVRKIDHTKAALVLLVIGHCGLSAQNQRPCMSHGIFERAGMAGQPIGGMYHNLRQPIVSLGRGAASFGQAQ